MSTSPISSGSFNTQECDTYSYETEDDTEAPQRSSTQAPQRSSTKRQSSAPQKRSSTKKHHREASPKKAKHHKEAKEKQKDRESSDSKSYVTKKEFQHLERTVHTLWDRLEIVEKKDASASALGPKVPSTMHRVGSFSSSEEQGLGKMVIALAAEQAKRIAGGPQHKLGGRHR